MHQNLKDLRNLAYEELLRVVEGFDEKPYRARQLYRWLFSRRAVDIDSMTDVSKGFRERLKGAGYYAGKLAVKKILTGEDSTVKCALSLEDSSSIECVLIPEKGRLTLCASTQTGCALGCLFCATGRIGPGRNLTLSELVGEVQAAEGLAGKGFIKGHKEITNVVLMGMGEPLLNFEEVAKFLEVLTDPMAFAPRKVTVSTAGIVPAIERLAAVTDANIAISLNATTDAVRSRLMPINRKYPIAELMACLRRYPLKKRRRITFEYVMIKGANDSIEDAGRLVKLLTGIPSKINLIPFNPFAGAAFEPSSPERVEEFRKILHDAGCVVKIRVSRGADIQAACGQLAGGG